MKNSYCGLFNFLFQLLSYFDLEIIACSNHNAGFGACFTFYIETLLVGLPMGPISDPINEVA